MTNKNLQSHLIAANPANPRDEMDQAVILITNHSVKLSVGLQINRVIPDLTLTTVARDLGIWYEGDCPIYHGGNNSRNKIHVVHSNDWSSLSTVIINEELSVTNDISVLAAISRGEGPEHFKPCAGYWTWEEGDLDLQVSDPRSSHKWETVPATAANVFGSDGSEQWRSVLEASAKLAVDVWF